MYATATGMYPDFYMQAIFMVQRHAARHALNNYCTIGIQVYLK